MDNIIDNRNIYNNLNSNINTLNNDKLILHDENSSLLVIIIDFQQLIQFDLESDISTIMKNIIIFINAHIAYSSSNKVCCIVNDDKHGVQFLYPNEEAGPVTEAKDAENVLKEDMYQGFKKVDETILSQLEKLIEEYKRDGTVTAANSSSTKKRSSLAGVISCGLTYIHRILKESISIRARIVVITGETLNSNIIQSHQYIPIMNCIFTAMKLKCPIDVLKINDVNLNRTLAKSNSFLQQATDATNGIYLELDTTNGMIQYLTTIFYLNTIITSTAIDNKLKINNSVDKLETEIANDSNSAKDDEEDIFVTSHNDILLKPTTSQVDFRTSCFLTGKTVAVGFVCNVCLVIISYIPAQLKDCPCCGSKFDIKTLKRLKYWQLQQSSTNKRGFVKKVAKPVNANAKSAGLGSSATPIEL